ncbi:hypothetical protein FE634_16575 [Nocardioides dongxiaopingii]|uniref:hypothetical protein n=1 Tax=Nocardioides sp. S-1144 TaxID=2582905 RepID=UPI00110F157E|nr:hypothetical protein [Nocardioides sp. S-1144]QCW51628.1 hypothetical protein FE634_16575 [Nocardioides sp. S-1144]
MVVENSTFYPLVRDGFEDESVMVVGNSGYIDARATITDHLGRPVRTLQLTDYLTEDRDAVLRAAWDGRTEAGSLVEAGSYTVAFSADYTTVIDGEVVQPTVHAVREVRVATRPHASPFRAFRRRREDVSAVERTRLSHPETSRSSSARVPAGDASVGVVESAATGRSNPRPMGHRR